MQPISLLLYLSLCFPMLSGPNNQDRKVTTNPSNSIERNLKLERTASARYLKIRVLLQANTKKKLSGVTNGVLKSLAKNANEDSVLEIARTQVASQFVGLSAQQSDLLVFYVLDEIAQLLVARENLNKKLDSLSEMSEETSLRLQNMMNRHSKFISMLSNLLKKISDTQNSIVQNLK